MSRILVVDDEPCVRDICVQFLSMAGYEVDTSASGEEALEAVSRRSYDLLILDLCMKGMSGLAIFNRVKSMTPAAKAVIFSCSADWFAPELDEARRNGLLGVLSKPFDLQALSALVEAALHGRMQAA
jgi:two-component system response regulator HydG